MAWSPVIQETRVDRPDEGSAGVARDSDETAATPTRGSFDSGKAAGLRAAKMKRQIDTTQTDGKSVPYDISSAG